MSNNETKSERELLMEQADVLGLEYKNNISNVKLKALVEAGNETEEVEEEVEVEVVKPVKKVPGKAKLLTEQEIVSARTSELRREMMELKRVIVSCNDPQMKEWETTPPYSINNSIVTLPKVVIPLNVEWHIPMAYYVMLKEMKCGIAIKKKDHKGRPITVRKSINKYNVQDLGNMSQEELDDLRGNQAGRDLID